MELGSYSKYVVQPEIAHTYKVKKTTTIAGAEIYALGKTASHNENNAENKNNTHLVSIIKSSDKSYCS
jgi:hypothetical protein